MTIDKIRCVYCGSTNVISTKITSSKRGLSVKGLFGEKGISTSAPQLEMCCPLCEKKYICILSTYPEYIKNHIQYTDVALNDIKRIFPRLRSLNRILESGTGIAKLIKKAQKLRSKDYDICFKINKIRAYLHCKKKKTLFVVVSVHEV